MSARSSEQKFNFNGEFFCRLCEKEFLDPRVLPCLHCFCFQCLQKLVSEQIPKSEISKPPSDWFHDWFGEYLSKDNRVKREYVRIRISASPKNKTVKLKNFKAVHHPELKCPLCGFLNKLPPKGVQDLPPHYLLQHRMLLNTLNKGEINFFCDLCSPEILATSRCTKCLLNFCSNCQKSHKRKKQFSEHEFTKLKKNRQDGSMSITKISRQVMCPSHSDSELKYYCSLCSMVACNKCCIQFHLDHNYELFSKAVQKYTSKIKSRLEETRSVKENTMAAINRLNILSQQYKSEYFQVEKEINTHIDNCVEAFEKHRKHLLAKAMDIKCEQMDGFDNRKKKLLQREQYINHVLKFGEDLLNEGSDFEILSFAFYLLQRLEWCIKFGDTASTYVSTNCYGALKLLSEKLSEMKINKSLFEITTTQVVSPSHCHITPEALEAFRNCREKERCELTLITKDKYGQRITHGAEGIEVSLKSCNSCNRNVPVCIVDQQNGVYLISFAPEASGELNLSISIRGVPIKGSPFSVIVETKNIHSGKFPSCIFCSKKQRQIAIGSLGLRKPGCYRDYCSGFIGRSKDPHWSCCKNAFSESEDTSKLHKNSDFCFLNL